MSQGKFRRPRVEAYFFCDSQHSLARRKERRNSSKMMIKVKTLTGKEIEVDIDGTDKIERIKERVEEKEGKVRSSVQRDSLSVVLSIRYSSSSATTDLRWKTDDGRQDCQRIQCQCGQCSPFSLGLAWRLLSVAATRTFILYTHTHRDT